MRFVFVATNRKRSRYPGNASFIYRCENLARGLKALGHDADLIHLSELTPWREGDLFLFHRPSPSLRLRSLAALLRRRGKLLMADLDDLIFDEAFAAESPDVRNGLQTEAKVRSLFAAQLRTLRLFSHFTVSTAPLAEHLRRLLPGSRVAVVPNAVYEGWRGLPLQGSFESRVISYLPGTRSHDRDFALAAPGLERYMKRHPETILKITGPLEFRLDLPPERIRYRPKVPFSDHRQNFREVWVNLAPLEPNVFNECKSALKVIEAGFFGIPTVTAPIPDAQRFAEAGALYASDAEELEARLEELGDPKRYGRLVSGLRERILERADARDSAEVLVHFAEEAREGNSR